MWSTTGVTAWSTSFSLYINDLSKCSNILDFHLFADDTNLFLDNTNILNLETNLNVELDKVSQWLFANKLSLNIEKTSFVVFHSPQRRIAHKLNLNISNMSVTSDNQVKYLGLIFDSNLNWKPYLHELSKKISRGIGVLSKIRHYVNRNILLLLYYSLIYPFLTYGLSIWGNTYSSTLRPLIILQKKATRIITFSEPGDHSEPLFKKLNILKLTDLVTLHNALLMYNYHHNLLPSSFENFFKTVASIHSYNTRLASKSTYYLNTIKTNYGKFNFRFAAVKVWNNLDESIKHLPLKSFKNKVMSNILHCSRVFFFFSFFPFSFFFLLSIY